MKKYIIVCLSALIIFSCKGKKDEVYIPEKIFVSILADMHLADAYYASHYEDRKTHSDSINFYNVILKNYGYTKAQFDTTLKFYSIHSDKFDILYEDVVTRLSKTEQDIYKNRSGDSELNSNIWYGKNSWYLPEEGAQKKIPISLKLKGKGRYTISFTYKVYHDDQSKNPRLNLYFAADSGSNSKRDTLQTILYEKDARTGIANITKELKDSTLTHLKGYLLDHDAKKGDWQKHVTIEGLKVLYSPVQ